MRKFYFISAITALSLAGCSSDEYLGGEGPNSPDEPATGIISFGGKSVAMTRADHVGADAASMLNNKFIVEGAKLVGTTYTEVFDDYQVQWKTNTAGTTESNTSDWEYVGLDALAPSSIAGNKQTIKYWDFTASQYDFAAYSTKDAAVITTGTPAAGQVKVSAIDYNNLNTAAYTLQGATADLAKCYIADLVTAYNPADFQKEVKFTFRNLASKVRVAFYETVPGYSVKNVKFYTDATTTLATGASETDVTLFTTGTTAADKFYTAGTYTINFPTTGSANKAESDYNKAHVAFAAETTGAGTTQAYGAINYGAKEANEKTGTEFLGRTSNTASFAGTAAPYYTTVLPNETGSVLELRVDYTLESIDGSGEEINIHGATAFVPAIYAAWKPNYAYTYIFKISDKTNGWTSTTVNPADPSNPGSTDPAGLYPITFDAVVVDSEEFTQSTITTVETPSITTYQKGHDITKDEYAAGDIYVQVYGSALAADLDTKGQLYTLSAAATEADVLSALNLQALSVASGYDVTGRNGLSLKKATSVATITAIPGVDGNDITVAAKTAAKFTATAGIYAYVYTVTAPTATEDITTAVSVAAGFDFDTAAEKYFTDEACTIQATGTTTAAGTYYQKYTKNNGVYGVKVIKVV